MTPTNIQLLLNFSHADTDLKISNSDGELNFLTQQTGLQSKISFYTTFPNQLSFTIQNRLPDHWAEVEEMWVGSLKLPKSIITQIFLCTDQDNNTKITSYWKNNCVITVDLFAGDWVQYHLLYGNKILVNK